MYYIQPTAGEKFYLCLLLTAVRGALSFDHLKTYKNVAYSSFEQACRARGLLDDDQEWHTCLQDASAMQTGRQLRALFVTILLDCAPAHPANLWMAFWQSICDDLQHALQQRVQPISSPTEDQIYDYGLYLIDKLMQQKGKHLKNMTSMPTSSMPWENEQENPYMTEQLNYNRVEEQQLAANLQHQFNLEQQKAFTEIALAVNTRSGKSFFLQGAGGCGKTFVYQVLSHHFRAEGQIVLCIASSGIAALLLMGGTTAHYRFKIPISIHEQSSCGIMKGSKEAEMLRHTALIIWDEALMLHRHAFEAVDRCLRDIRMEDRLFGGVTTVLGGDYQQILPVITRGSQADIVSASLFTSPIWQQLHLLTLVRNMRVQDDMEEMQFAQWLLDIGHGKNTDSDGNVLLPTEFYCAQNTVQNLINEIYPNIQTAHCLPHPDQYFSERAILSARNADVNALNQTILDLFPGDTIHAHSADSVQDEK